MKMSSKYTRYIPFEYVLSTKLNKLKYFIITNIKYHFIALNLKGNQTNHRDMNSLRVTLEEEEKATSDGE